MDNIEERLSRVETKIDVTISLLENYKVDMGKLEGRVWGFVALAIGALLTALLRG